MSEKRFSLIYKFEVVIVVLGAVLKISGYPIGGLITMLALAGGAITSGYHVSFLKKRNTDLEKKLVELSKNNTNEI